MKAALAVLLVATAACAIWLIMRHSEAPAPVPRPRAEAAAAAAAPHPDPDLLPPSEDAQQQLQEETQLVHRLCLPDTYAPNSAGVGMKNIPQSVGAFEAGLAQIRQKLALSVDPEHLFTAAFISDSPEEQLVLAKKALRTMAYDANLLQKAIGFCLDFRGESACPLRAWEQALLNVDSQNSESWMLIATNRYDRGDHAGALDAVRQAGSASHSRRFIPETVQLVKRSLAAASDLPDHMQFIDAFGIVAALKPDDRRLTMCERASGSSEWLAACLEYGRLAERQGMVLLTRSVGLAIQRRMLQALGDEEEQAAVARRAAALRLESAPDDEWSGLRMLLLQADPGTQRTFLETWVQSGESAAYALVDDELNRRLDAADPIDCSGL